MRWVVPLFALALLAVPAATAHGAPPPPGHFTRLLADCVDDWFGDDSLGGSDTGYDLHAVDLREAYTNSDVLGFRIIMNGAGPAQFTLGFTVDGTAKTVTFSTTGSAWNKGTATAIAGPGTAFEADGQTPDGDRFWVEAQVRRSDVGASIGSVLDAFTLSSKVGSDDADAIPGYHGSDPLRRCESGDGAPYDRGAVGDYKVRGTTYYGTFEVDPASAQVLLDTERFINLRLGNDLNDQAQAFTVTYTGGDGLTVRFHNPGTGGYSDEGKVTIAKKQSNLLHLAVSGDQAGASGTLMLTVTTNLGGRWVDTFDYTVESGTGPTSTGPTPGSSSPSEGSPLPLVPVFGVLVLGVLWRRSR